MKGLDNCLDMIYMPVYDFWNALRKLIGDWMFIQMILCFESRIYNLRVFTINIIAYPPLLPQTPMLSYEDEKEKNNKDMLEPKLLKETVRKIKNRSE